MIGEKQDMMHEHADCLEQMLSVLKQNPGMRKVCTYSSLLEATPLKDEYFTWTPVGNRK